MSFNSDRQKELNEKGMFGYDTPKGKKQKPKKSYNDLSIIENYNQKMNMLAPGSLISKVIGIIIVLGIVLYFCNIYIGFWIVILGIVMYLGLRVYIKIKDKDNSKGES